jgi:predicted Zn-dependent protease with MMP-like domain
VSDRAAEPRPGRDDAAGPSSFEELVQRAIASVPDELRDRMSNVEFVIDGEPPPGKRLLGLYEGVPLTMRTSWYSGVAPDKITIFRGPIERLYGHDAAELEAEVRRIVLHEIAHHFGISDERLVEIDRY